MTQPPERASLAREMDDRREELGLSWTDVAERAGIAAQTLLRIRKGSAPMKVSTRQSIEAALRWRPASINTIMAGGTPAPEEAPAGGTAVSKSPAGGTNLWITTPNNSHIMVPLAFDAIPGLRDASDEERAALTDSVVAAMMHAANVYLSEEGRRRQAGQVDDEAGQLRTQER